MLSKFSIYLVFIWAHPPEAEKHEVHSKVFRFRGSGFPFQVLAPPSLKLRLTLRAFHYNPLRGIWNDLAHLLAPKPTSPSRRRFGEARLGFVRVPAHSRIIITP